MRVLNGKIDGVHYEISYVGELVSDPDSMGCCLDGFANNFVPGAIYVLIVELEFFCKGAEDRCPENECLVLRESVPRDS